MALNLWGTDPNGNPARLYIHHIPADELDEWKAKGEAAGWTNLHSDKWVDPLREGARDEHGEPLNGSAPSPSSSRKRRSSSTTRTTSRSTAKKARTKTNGARNA